MLSPFQYIKETEGEATMGAPLSRSTSTASTYQQIADILGKPTAMEASAAERFKKHVPSVREFCQHGTKMDCYREMTKEGRMDTCRKLHFRRVIESHTDVSLGDCAYLSTCRRTRTCKYIHYEIEEEEKHDQKEPAQREEQEANQPGCHLGSSFKDSWIRPKQMKQLAKEGDVLQTDKTPVGMVGFLYTACFEEEENIFI